MTLPTIPRVDYHGVRAEIGKLVKRLLKTVQMIEDGVAWSRKNPGEIGCASEVESIRHTDTLNLREKRADLR